MVNTLNMLRFRGFDSYQLTGLARVNLLVGKNNCGKTSILEAVEFLISRGSAPALSESALRRSNYDEDGANWRFADRTNVSRLFYGHEFSSGASFELSSLGDSHRLTAKIVRLDDVGKAADRWESMTMRKEQFRQGKESMPVFGLSFVSDGQESTIAPLSENGAVLGRYFRPVSRNEREGKAVHFLDFAPRSMRAAWNKLVALRRDTEIVKAMRILIPDIDSVHFLAGNRRSGVLVGRQGRPCLPIGTYGDGMTRLLAISLALAATEDGCLLIDDIDTGFHWTVMQDLWRLIVQTAERSNVQVFATTHSFDCVKGLGTLVRSYPELGGLVSIQKVHGALKHAVCLPGKEIPIAVEQKIEVR